MEYPIKILEMEVQAYKNQIQLEATSSEYKEILKAHIVELETAIQKLKFGESIFVMEMELHTPINPDKPCYSCVLESGPMCLDRSYCKFKETGKTWKKKLKQEAEG